MLFRSRVEAGSDRTGGRQAYFATAKLNKIEQDIAHEGYFYGLISDYLAFPLSVPFRENDNYHESLLQRGDGKTNKGAFGRSVRLLPEPEFQSILSAGFLGVRDDLGAEDWEVPSYGPGLYDRSRPFEHVSQERPILERMTRRPFREAAFARNVKSAYSARCAMTGLRILNGGGRPEVQAAPIRPVAEGGPDTVRNGLALSGTMHWMFDRGLISVDDDHTILVARDHVPAAVTQLLVPGGKLLLPPAAHLQPHPIYLGHHRTRFKG